MSVLWLKEWREFAPSWTVLALRLLGPLLVVGPFLRAGEAALPALALVVGYLGVTTTAAQVARERASGVLPRIGLTPCNPALILLQRIASRSLLVLLQVVPLLALAPELSGVAAPAAVGASALGALTGLRAQTRRAAVLGGLGLTGLAALGTWQFAPPAPAPLPLWTGAALLSAAALSAAPAIFQTWAE